MSKGLTIFFAVIVLLGIYGFLFWHPVYLLTETLQVGETEEEGDGNYIIGVYDKLGSDVANIAFITGMVTLPSENMTSIRLSVWHEEGTHLDSLQVSFVPSILHHPFHVYLETPPGGKWTQIDTESSGEKQVFTFPGLGVYGSGTLTLEFLVRRSSTLPLSLIHI